MERMGERGLRLLQAAAGQPHPPRRQCAQQERQCGTYGQRIRPQWPKHRPSGFAQGAEVVHQPQQPGAASGRIEQRGADIGLLTVMANQRIDRRFGVVFGAEQLGRPDRLDGFPIVRALHVRRDLTRIGDDPTTHQILVLCRLAAQCLGQLGLVLQAEAQAIPCGHLVADLLRSAQAAALGEFEHHLLDAQGNQQRRQQNQDQRQRRGDAKCRGPVTRLGFHFQNSPDPTGIPPCGACGAQRSAGATGAGRPGRAGGGLTSGDGQSPSKSGNAG